VAQTRGSKSNAVTVIVQIGGGGGKKQAAPKKKATANKAPRVRRLPTKASGVSAARSALRTAAMAKPGVGLNKKYKGTFRSNPNGWAAWHLRNGTATQRKEASVILRQSKGGIREHWKKTGTSGTMGLAGPGYKSKSGECYKKKGMGNACYLAMEPGERAKGCGKGFGRQVRHMNGQRMVATKCQERGKMSYKFDGQLHQGAVHGVNMHNRYTSGQYPVYTGNIAPKQRGAFKGGTLQGAAPSTRTRSAPKKKKAPADKGKAKQTGQLTGVNSAGAGSSGGPRRSARNR
jgi:hypothetical protein